jgi:hypothetical protein
MFAIIDFFVDIFGGIIDILNTRFFSDVNITFLQIILISILLKFVIRFLFGGFKEVDISTNYLSRSAYGNAISSISNNERKRELFDIFSGEFTYINSRGRFGYYNKKANIMPNGSVSKVVTHVEM